MSIPDSLIAGLYRSASTAALNREAPAQVRFSYDANQNLVYMAFGRKGIASSDAGWLIFKYTVDANENVTLVQSSQFNGVWDDRATTTYS